MTADRNRRFPAAPVMENEPAVTRWVLLRDVAVFHGKLVLDGLKDIADSLIELSSVISGDARGSAAILQSSSLLRASELVDAQLRLREELGRQVAERDARARRQRLEVVRDELDVARRAAADAH